MNQPVSTRAEIRAVTKLRVCASVWSGGSESEGAHQPALRPRGSMGMLPIRPPVGAAAVFEGARTAPHRAAVPQHSSRLGAPRKRHACGPRQRPPLGGLHAVTLLALQPRGQLHNNHDHTLSLSHKETPTHSHHNETHTHSHHNETPTHSHHNETHCQSHCHGETPLTHNQRYASLHDRLCRRRHRRRRFLTRMTTRRSRRCSLLTSRSSQRRASLLNWPVLMPRPSISSAPRCVRTARAHIR